MTRWKVQFTSRDDEVNYVLKSILVGIFNTFATNYVSAYNITQMRIISCV